MLDIDPNHLMLSMLLGAFGMGYFLYGKKQGNAVALISGVVLMVFPYFIYDLWLMGIVGAGLIFSPLLIK